MCEERVCAGMVSVQVAMTRNATGVIAMQDDTQPARPGDTAQDKKHERRRTDIRETADRKRCARIARMKKAFGQ
jgi:hypothetical protein